MQDLILFLARSLVDHPEQVQVEEFEEGRTLVYELHVAEEDMGKIIGRQGRIIKAIRSVVRASAARRGMRVAVEVV